MYTDILIPTDGSELAEKAVQHGIALAKTIGAKTIVPTVLPPSTVELRGDSMSALANRVRPLAAEAAAGSPRKATVAPTAAEPGWYRYSEACGVGSARTSSGISFPYI